MGQDRYPLPDHAANIWTDGKKIYLTFPGYKGNEDRNFNTVVLEPHLPCKCKECGATECAAERESVVTVQGRKEIKKSPCNGRFESSTIEVLWSILTARANAKTAEDRKIGSKATPVQYDLEKVQRYMKGSGKAAKKDISDFSVDDMMKELGL